MSLKRRFEKKLAAKIRDNHMNRYVALGARLCNRYLVNYWNQYHWNMWRNGESRLLRTLAAEWGGTASLTAFDVGANTGSYARLVRQILPNSTVHCFEILPATRRALAEEMRGVENIVIPDYGLSNSDAPLRIGFKHDNDCEARAVSPLSGELKGVITCPVRTGDAYLARQGLATVDLLKLDTEGHEIAVLHGFAAALTGGQVRAIQFEYGTTWIPPRRLLYDAYELLEPAGYRLGRLYPEGVFFKPYNRLEDDHFRMGNYVAVHTSCDTLIRALNLNPTGCATKLGVN